MSGLPCSRSTSTITRRRGWTPDVLAAMLPYLHGAFRQSVVAAWRLVRAAGEAVRAAREQVRALIGAEHATRSSSRRAVRNRTTRRFCPRSNAQAGRNEIIVSAVEHPAVLSLVQHLAKHRGAVVRTIPVDGKGGSTRRLTARRSGRKTAIASIMWANNETGTIFPGGGTCRARARGRRPVPHRRRAGGRAAFASM